jgi:hypothetical protein
MANKRLRDYYTIEVNVWTWDDVDGCDRAIATVTVPVVNPYVIPDDKLSFCLEQAGVEPNTGHDDAVFIDRQQVDSILASMTKKKGIRR